ncbi:MAG: bifunctional diguanylate cyclase/phosphodiesterase, partial [Alphaproteobacteria bacterium]|nr:bifunctional diguanylate cyclase/phosphodiesterase [Alphaproteobacteria bacterium]
MFRLPYGTKGVVRRMTLVQAIRRWFWLGDARTPAGRALLAEQFRILTSQMPVLYGVLIIDSISIAYVLPASLPLASRFAAPLALLVMSVWRMVHWARLRAAPPAAEDALRFLTKARILSATVNIVFSAWALGLFGAIDASLQAPLALLVFMGSVGSAYCLASVPSMARLTLIVSALPISLRLVFTGDPLLVCIGLNLCLMLGLLVRMMNTYSRGLVKLVASRTKMSVARERARRANAAAHCEHAKAAEI